MSLLLWLFILAYDSVLAWLNQSQAIRIWGGQGLEFLYARRTENSLCGRYQEKSFYFLNSH